MFQGGCHANFYWVKDMSVASNAHCTQPEIQGTSAYSELLWNSIKKWWYTSPQCSQSFTAYAIILTSVSLRLRWIYQPLRRLRHMETHVRFYCIDTHTESYIISCGLNDMSLFVSLTKNSSVTLSLASGSKFSQLPLSVWETYIVISTYLKFNITGFVCCFQSGSE